MANCAVLGTLPPIPLFLCFSQEENGRRLFPLVHRQELCGGAGGKPCWVICGSGEDVTGTDTRLSASLLLSSAAVASPVSVSISASDVRNLLTRLLEGQPLCHPPHPGSQLRDTAAFLSSSERAFCSGLLFEPRAGPAVSSSAFPSLVCCLPFGDALFPRCQVRAGILVSAFGQVPGRGSSTSPQLLALNVCWACTFKFTEPHMLFFLLFLIRNKLERNYIIIKVNVFNMKSDSRAVLLSSHLWRHDCHLTLINAVPLFGKSGTDSDSDLKSLVLISWEKIFFTVCL